MDLITTGAQRTMSSREIAELTDKRHDHVLRDIENMIAELGYTSPQIWGDLPDSYGRPQRVAFLPKRECLILVSGYSVTMRARIIDRWQELESGAAPTITGTTAEAAVRLLGTVADVLRLPPSGRLGMVRQCIESKAPDLLPMIPAYAVDAPADAPAGSSEPTASATVLLKEYKACVGAVEFNRLAVAAGLLERLTRPSTAGKGERTFLSLTAFGLKYGKNVTSPQNPRETQPHWYRARFGDVLQLLIGQEGGAA